MKTKTLGIITMLLCFSLSNSKEFVGTESSKYMNTFINNSDLIIRGKLIDKYSRKETMLKTFSIKENEKAILKDVILDDIFTTYTFEVIEVMSGNYNERTIDVKMTGGCDELEGICVTVSLGYEYDMGQDAVLFLKYDDRSGNYFSYAATRTAFKIGQNNQLYTGHKDSLMMQIAEGEINNINQVEVLTVESLREAILLVKSEQGGDK